MATQVRCRHPLPALESTLPDTVCADVEHRLAALRARFEVPHMSLEEALGRPEPEFEDLRRMTEMLKSVVAYNPMYVRSEHHAALSTMCPSSGKHRALPTARRRLAPDNGVCGAARTMRESGVLEKQPTEEILYSDLLECHRRRLEEMGVPEFWCARRRSAPVRCLLSLTPSGMSVAQDPALGLLPAQLRQMRRCVRGGVRRAPGTAARRDGRP